MPKRFIIALFLLALSAGSLFYRPVTFSEDPSALITSHVMREDFKKYKNFNRSDSLAVIITARRGDIFNPDFLNLLRKITDDIFYMPGVDRYRLLSLTTRNLNYHDIIVDGFEGWPLIPDDFKGTDQDFGKLKKNILKTPYIGKLVSNDFKSALISVPYLEPQDGPRLTRQIQKILPDNSLVRSSVLGYDAFLIDMKNQLRNSFLTFAVTWLIALILGVTLTRSTKTLYALLAGPCLSVLLPCAVFGLAGIPINIHGFPVLILIFLLSFTDTLWIALNRGKNTRPPCAWPAMLPLFSIAFIGSPIGYQIAGLALAGALSLCFTSALFGSIDPNFKALIPKKSTQTIFLFPSGIKLLLIIVVLLTGIWGASKITIGNPGSGPSILRNNAGLLKRQRAMISPFDFSLDSILVLAISPQRGCTDPETVSTLEDMIWDLSGLPGVRTIWSLAGTVKKINTFYHENYIKWTTIPREKECLLATTSFLEPSIGLFDQSEKIMPVTIYLENHDPETLAKILQVIRDYSSPRNLLGLKIVGGTAVLNALMDETLVATARTVILIFLVILLLISRTQTTASGSLKTGFFCCVYLLWGLAALALTKTGLSLDTLTALLAGLCMSLYIFWSTEKNESIMAGLMEVPLITLLIIIGGILSTLNVIFWTSLFSSGAILLGWLWGKATSMDEVYPPDSCAKT